MPEVKKGPWGYYFPYIDESGKERGLKLLDWVYDKYYTPGYLTDQHLADMIIGKTVAFIVPDKTGRVNNVTAKVVPYTTTKGVPCKIIKFESDKIDDNKMILANAEKIATSYWDAGSSRFDYTKPQAVLNTVDLVQTWKTYATNEVLSGKKYGTIHIYRLHSRKNDSIDLYCEVDVEANSVKIITEEEYKVIKQKAKEQYEKESEERAKRIKDLEERKTWYLNHIYNIYNEIYENRNDSSALDKVIETYAKDVNVPDIDNLVAGLITSHTSYRLNDIYETTKKDIERVYCYIARDSFEERCSNYLTSYLKKIKIFVEYIKIRNVRQQIWDRVESEGLEAVTSTVDVDTALDIGKFKEVQKVLVKYKSDAPKYIIFNMYENILNKTELETNLLNLLKIYYDFYDMPEKDRQSVAKFIAKHRLKDYYEKISKYDDVLETLIDNSRDPKLTKPLLEGIAGTSRASVLKDKTFYFEKRGRLRDEVLLYKPIELVDELRKHIKEFNVSSNVAILTNIELDSDESFIFQFYTFAEGEGDEKGFDGRRMLNLTRIYNRNHPKAKIGFVFGNDDIVDED
jgi:hypothetical protein